MKRGLPLAEALAGRVLYGDVSPEDAHAVLRLGVPDDVELYRGSVEGEREAARAALAQGRRAWLHFDDGRIADAARGAGFRCKPGAFWMPAALDASAALDAAAVDPKGEAHAWRWQTGLRNAANVAAVLAVGVESDFDPPRSQAELLDFLDREHGLRPALVVMSGDDRPASLARLCRPDLRALSGKSLHVFFPIRACAPDAAALERCKLALCALLRGDLQAIDPARLLRAPGAVVDDGGNAERWKRGAAVRVQTILRAEPDAEPWDVEALADRLEDACRVVTGKTAAAAIEALRCADDLDKAAGTAHRSAAKERAERPGRAGALDGEAWALREHARRVRSTLTVDDDASEVRASAGGADAAGNAGRVGKGYAQGGLPRESEVTATLPGGRTLTLPLWRWSVELARREHDWRADGLPLGLPCWAPTPAGLVRSTGEPRKAASATLALRRGEATIACHVEGVVYRPARRVDPGANLARPLPAVAAWQAALDLPPGALVILTGDTGTGKTTALADFVRAVRALVVTPRVALTRAAARIYRLTGYKALRPDERADSAVWHDNRGIAICLNSLPSLALPDDGAPLWLVLEESEQLAAALFGRTLADQTAGAHLWRNFNGDVLEALRVAAAAALASGGGIVCADAFAGDRTDALLRAILPADVFARVQRVGHSRRRAYDVTSYAERADLHTATLAAVTAGKRVAVACLTAAGARDWQTKLAAVRTPDGAPPRVKLYVGKGDNPDLIDDALLPREVEELADVNAAWGPEVCDAVVYSPVVSSGLSYDRKGPGEGFDLAVLDWGAPFLAYGDWTLAVQMLDRVRSPGAFAFYAPAYDKGAGAVREVDVCRDAIAAAAGGDRRAVGLATPAGIAADALADLKAVHLHVCELRRAAPRADLIAYFKCRGARVVEGDALADAEAWALADRARQAAADEAARRRKDWGELVCAARPFDGEADVDAADRRLRDLPRGDARDRLLADLHAHRLRDRYGAEHLTADLVADDARRGLASKVREACRARLVAEGDLARASEEAARAVESGTDAAARGELAKTTAALGLLRLTLGDSWVDELLAGLAIADRGQLGGIDSVMPSTTPHFTRGRWRSDARGGLAVEGGAPMSPAVLAKAWKRSLATLGIAAAEMAGTGFALDDVAAHGAAKAIGRALERIGAATGAKRDAVPGSTGKRGRSYALNVEAWALHCARSRREARRWLGLPLAPVLGADAYYTRGVVDGPSPPSQSAATLCENEGNAVHNPPCLLNRNTPGLWTAAPPVSDALSPVPTSPPPPSPPPPLPVTVDPSPSRAAAIALGTFAAYRPLPMPSPVPGRTPAAAASRPPAHTAPDFPTPQRSAPSAPSVASTRTRPPSARCRTAAPAAASKARAAPSSPAGQLALFDAAG